MHDSILCMYMHVVQEGAGIRLCLAVGSECLFLLFFGKEKTPPGLAISVPPAWVHPATSRHTV